MVTFLVEATGDLKNNCRLTGKAVCNDNCLQTINPKLSKEWHTTKNGNLTPKDVTANSGKKVWWICNKGHEWRTSIDNRNGKNSGCPYCSGRRVCNDNCLQTINPKLASEWHSTNNGSLTPRDVTPSSHKKVWWICEIGHEWKAVISSRNRGSGCPYCSGRLPTKDNNLKVINPDLAKEWHPFNNFDLAPKNVSPNSGIKAWWICNKGHEWEARVYSRAKGHGCPYCSRRQRSS